MRLFALLLLITSIPVLADGNASYQEGILTIPSVNAPNQVSQYQDATFKLLPDGNWQLLDYLEKDSWNYHNPNKSFFSKAKIIKVELITTSSFPVQVFLKVNGTIGGCSRLGESYQRLTKKSFEVSLNKTLPDIRAVDCVAELGFFTKTIPLQVYGLAAGTYNYNLNGQTGSFTLTADNKFAGDFDGSN